MATDWLRQMLGLSAAWSGVIQDTASTSTLVALLCARERATGLQPRARRPAGESPRRSSSTRRRTATARSKKRRSSRLRPRQPALDPVRRRACAMRPDALDRRDRRRTWPPAGCPARSSRRPGTTTTTAIDPIDGDRRHRAAGTASGCTSTRPWPARRWSCRSAGGCGTASNGADSIVVNPHKWLGAAFDCSVYFVRDPDELVRVMSTNPSYLQTAADRES